MVDELSSRAHDRADFGILLGLAFQTFSDELRQSLHERGFDDLGRSYGYFFRALADGPLRLHELSPGLGITDQGAMKIVDEMAGRGYLERRPDPEDGRAKLISLAPRGRAALAAARRFHAAYERRLGRTLGVAHVATTRRVLEALVATSGVDAAKARLRAV
jgi:DNA-binding MarR family transcriptional regulator